MAGGDPQKQLLMLIRDFATEKSQGERRVSDLKKRSLDLRVELDAATSSLEDAKLSKESAEHELKGAEVELSMADASVLAQEARIRLLQEQVSKVGSDIAYLKNDEGVLRDDFVSAMSEVNKKIRSFQEMTAQFFQKQKYLELSADSGKIIEDKKGFLNSQENLKGIEDSIASANTEAHVMEREYQDELHKLDEVLQALANTERRAFLAEAVVDETKMLRELARQTAELEKTYSSLGEELKKKYACPSCQFNNMGNLEDNLLGESGEN